jgi:hypothetical protein
LNSKKDILVDISPEPYCVTLPFNYIEQNKIYIAMGSNEFIFDFQSTNMYLTTSIVSETYHTISIDEINLTNTRLKWMNKFHYLKM